MNQKFQSMEDLAAIEYLMEGTEGECTERLISRYYEYREYGMSVDDAVVRSELSHIYYDHGGEERIQSKIPLTMKLVHDRIVEDSVNEQTHPLVVARKIPTADKVNIITELFDKYVSWGFSLAFSLFHAANVAREVLDEKYPVTDEIAYEYLASFQEPIIRGAMIEGYREIRNNVPDMPAGEALDAVWEYGQKASALQAIFGPVIGYGSPGKE